MEQGRRVTTKDRAPRMLASVLIGLLCCILALESACSTAAGRRYAATATAASRGPLPSFSHIFVIVMENREYGDIIGSPDAPYLNSLAQTYGLATASYAITHPSVPNYLALLGGLTFSATSDCTTCLIAAPNLVDALEAGHKTWRAYMESQPRPCFLGDAPPYVQRHNPFVYFDDIRNNTARCQQIVPLDGLPRDLTSGQTPDFVWITPNLCSDMHDCSTKHGDKWLASWAPRILASPAWKQGGVLFITWDEGTTTEGCCQVARGGHIATLVISPLGKPHYQSSTPYNHYSLLRSITDAWGLHRLGHAANPATNSFADFFSAPR